MRGTGADKRRTAILHYSAPPVVGGVEAVIDAHVRVFLRNGYPVRVVAGRGEGEALATGAEFTLIPEMDTLHPQIAEISAQLERGEFPPEFAGLEEVLASRLAPVLESYDTLIVHNVFTKHFNLPLTAALARLLDGGLIRRCLAWCHDFTWTSPTSRSKVHLGYPWDLLREYRPDVTYVTVSRRRQADLAGLFACPAEHIRVVYNGVDPLPLLGLSPEGHSLVERLELFECDLVLLMPVRVTRAKNIEFAIQVVAALKRRGARIQLILTGPPDPHEPHSMDYFETLREMRRKMGVEREMRFVFEAGPAADQPYFISSRVVGDLYRVSDALFMPSHREGFGMPVLEASLVGLPVVSAHIPASEEIGGGDMTLIDPEEEPETVAERILSLVESSPVYRLRRKVRQNFTWEAIFRKDIEPLLFP